MADDKRDAMAAPAPAQVRVSVQEADFDPGALARALETGHSGAVVTFTGTVRSLDGNRPVTHLVLEHYPGMTERSLHGLADRAQARWPLSGLTLLHRVGTLAAGERIVFVGVASAHREAAFEACRFLMDHLKTEAPFWKRELGPSGSRWIEARASDERARDAWDALKSGPVPPN
jgi:molybdopterin synthase catalytic subunit